MSIAEDSRAALAGDACEQPTTETCCVWCGLPVAGSLKAEVTPGRPAESEAPVVYCCYGCRFAHSVVREQGNEGAIRWTVIRLGLAIFFAMNLMAFTMTMWSLDVYDVQPDPFQIKLYEVFRWLSMLFALPVLLLLGVPLLQNAIDTWRQRTLSTDLLIGVAVLAAYLTSMINVMRGTGTIYFEVGATVLVMITLGRWIEAVGRQKATEALDRLLTLLPENVTRLSTETHHETGADEQVVPAAQIELGDILRIRAGERFPADAVIVHGQTTVDEQVFTGESVPLHRQIGDGVLAGTVNLDGDIQVRVTALYREGSFGRLLSVLQHARAARGYYQRMADRVASYFFPVMTLITVAAFAWHLSAGIGTAIQVAMSVLLIACPCALGLATPLAVWTSLSTAVRNQVLFRSGEAVERLANVRAVCLDKTGTLTTGQPQVCQTATFGESADGQALQLAAVLALSSSHPFSKAVAKYAQRSAVHRATSGSADCPALLSLRTVAGGGVEATTVAGQVVRLGSVEFACCSVHHDARAEQQPMQAAPSLCVACRAAVPLGLRVQMDRLRMAADQQAASIVLLSIDHVPALGFLISESIRPEAREALLQLSRVVDVLHVLSGDRPAKAQYLMDQLQVPGLQVECRLTPEQKVLRVAEVRRSHGTTVMVGDGINDAPALAASDVGIAMGCGADVSRDSAQICLLSNDLTRIPWAIDLARRTQAVIRQNLFWAFGYNGIGVCLAASGLLNPAVAAGLMILSSLLVISNSLRLLKDPSVQSDDHLPPDSSGLSEAAGSARVPGTDAEDGFSESEPLVRSESKSCDVSSAAEIG